MPLDIPLQEEFDSLIISRWLIQFRGFQSEITKGIYGIFKLPNYQPRENVLSDNEILKLAENFGEDSALTDRYLTYLGAMDERFQKICQLLKLSVHEYVTLSLMEEQAYLRVKYRDSCEEWEKTQKYIFEATEWGTARNKWFQDMLQGLGGVLGISNEHP